MGPPGGVRRACSTHCPSSPCRAIAATTMCSGRASKAAGSIWRRASSSGAAAFENGSCPRPAAGAPRCPTAPGSCPGCWSAPACGPLQGGRAGRAGARAGGRYRSAAGVAPETLAAAGAFGPPGRPQFVPRPLAVAHSPPSAKTSEEAVLAPWAWILASRMASLRSWARCTNSATAWTLRESRRPTRPARRPRPSDGAARLQVAWLKRAAAAVAMGGGMGGGVGCLLSVSAERGLLGAGCRS